GPGSLLGASGAAPALPNRSFPRKNSSKALRRQQEPLMSNVLARVNHPHDLKGLSPDELRQLAGEIRQRIMEVVNVNGGHLASNLGTVEITLALHKVFDFPRDRLGWGGRHPHYPHKRARGRKDRVP